MSKHNVAVYGTLKQGYGNHRLLAHVPKHADGTISGYRLFQSGIPFLVKDDTSDYDVTVEVYQVDDVTLSSLDRLEGHPSFYCRHQRQIDLPDGQSLTAWIYEHPPVPYTENTTGVF